MLASQLLLVHHSARSVNDNSEIEITKAKLRFSLAGMHVLSFTGVGKSRRLSPVPQSAVGLLLTFSQYFSNDHRNDRRLG
jgi:hypothetical protein